MSLFLAAYKNPITAITSIIAPVFMFSHIYFLYHPEINKGGIFGYKFWSVFFNSMMWPLFSFTIGYLIQVLSSNYITDIKGKKYAKLISVKAYCISVYYFTITIFPYDNSYARIGLHHAWYYVIAVVSSLLVTLIIIKAPERIKGGVTKQLKNAIKAIHYLFSVLYKGLEEKDLINPWKKTEFKKYRVEITNKVVDYEEGKN